MARAAAVDLKTRKKRSRVEEAGLIEEDQTQIGQESEDRPSKKLMQADITQMAQEDRIIPYSRIPDKAMMLSAGGNAEERIFKGKRKHDAENGCRELKRKKTEPVKIPTQRLMTFYSKDKTEKLKSEETSTIVQGIPKRQRTDGQDGIEQLDCSTHKGIS